MFDGIKQQIAQKELQKERYKKSYTERTQENEKLTKQHFEYLRHARQLKSLQQSEYNKILDSQMKLKSDLDSKYGAMTENERKINMRDLSVKYCYNCS